MGIALTHIIIKDLCNALDVRIVTINQYHIFCF